ncbi:ubiquitin-specific protease doa4 [Coemansia sp. RSA 989]|nr:hypothetical protein BX667DRAFT_498335 [Coemansia mojavensis]KAJ1864659.1 ubiquitin-specific protease doa4 [Coemansia sp. RSA 989]
MSRLGDGRTSDLIRRFENLALEKSGGNVGKQPQTKPMPKRLSSIPIDTAQGKGQEAPKASQPTPLASIAAAQSALSAAITHAQPTQSEEQPAKSDAKTAELSTKSRIRASSDVTRPPAIGHSVAEAGEPGLNSRSRSSTIDSASARSYTSQLSPVPMDKIANVQSGKGLLARLNRRADIDPALQVSPSSWLAFAQRCVDEARLCQETGDLETAYVRYMMACNIISKKFHRQRESSPVAKDPAYLKLRKDVSTWIIDELEGLHQELKRRSDVEAMSSDSQVMTAEQLDQMESKFSQMYPENPSSVLQADNALETPQPTTSQTNRSDSSLSGTRLIAEQQSRFDEIDAQVQQNDASVKDMQTNVAVIGQNRGNRRVAVAMSPTLPSIDEAPKRSNYIDPNATTCTPQELRSLISQAQASSSGRPTILLLDVRPQRDFAQGRINHRFIVNIDPLSLPAKCTSSEIESSLVLVSEEQQTWFHKRDEFDVVVYVSQSMRMFGDTSSKELAPLNALNSAIYHYEYRKPLQHPPLFLIGGFDAWLREVGSEYCLWSQSSQMAQTDGQRQPSPPQHTSASATTTHDISGMLAYHAPTSGLSQTPPSQVQYPAKAAASGAGTVHDFFQQHNGYHQQQHQSQQQQQQQYQYQQARHQAVYESATHGYNVHTSMPELQYAQQHHAPYVPSKPSALVHEAQLMHQPKTVFDNPTYGFTGPVYLGRTPNEYPVVEPPQPLALPTLGSDMQQQQQEDMRLMEQRKKRRAPPPIPMPQLPQLPPKPAGYTQQQPPQRPQMQAELQTASPRSSIPAFYNHPVAAGSDPSLNGRMHAGGNLRNSAAYQQQVLLQPDPAMGQHLNAAMNMPPAATTQPPQHASQLPDSAGYGATGLKNFGNTCFMNSVIQCLVGTVPLTRYFMRGEWKKDMARDASAQSEVSVEFARLLENMWRGQYASISPIGFRSAVAKCSEQFKGNDQEDAHEFASFLLDSLHESLNHIRPRPPPERELTTEEEKQFEQLPDEQQAQLQWKRFTRRNWSIITSIFQGQIQSRLTCMSCKHTSTTYHTFTELSVPIPSLKHNGAALVRKSQARQMPVNIYQCLDAYSETEILDGDNKWHCPHCRTKRKAAKRLMISRLPLVLIVHLKRFSTIGHFREKLETNVLVPTQKLYMQNYVIPGHHQSTMYNLYGVANHFGTLSSGHYTASVFNGLRDQWNYFDDTRVSPIPESQVATPAAYLLFFVQTQ